MVDIDLALDDAAAQPLPDEDQLASGAYRPANYVGPGTDDFPAPTPPERKRHLAVFDGTNPNGIWSLYVVDDEINDAGSLGAGI